MKYNDKRPKSRGSPKSKIVIKVNKTSDTIDKELLKYIIKVYSVKNNKLVISKISRTTNIGEMVIMEFRTIISIEWISYDLKI